MALFILCFPLIYFVIKFENKQDQKKIRDKGDLV